MSKFVLSLALLLLLVDIFELFRVRGQELQVIKEWERFKIMYKKNYTKLEEEERRFKIFEENLKRTEELCSRDPFADYGVTQFMDLTPEEFRSKYLMNNLNFTLPHPNEYFDIPHVDPSTFPSSFDWRSRGVITNVYNQGNCGSCWSFSVTENIESMWAISGHGLVSLSMQQLVDCDYYDGGCQGGIPARAFTWVIQNGGLDAYNTYPYYAVKKACTAPRSPVARISSYGFITTSDNENAMFSFLLNYGPPSVCVDAELWQFYRGGVVTGNCGYSLNHAVQLVGYDTINNIPVWIVRNSWGPGWGVNGYIYLMRGANVCGVGSYVTSSKV